MMLFPNVVPFTYHTLNGAVKLILHWVIGTSLKPILSTIALCIGTSNQVS